MEPGPNGTDLSHKHRRNNRLRCGEASQELLRTRPEPGNTPENAASSQATAWRSACKSLIIRSCSLSQCHSSLAPHPAPYPLYISLLLLRPGFPFDLARNITVGDNVAGSSIYREASLCAAIASVCLDLKSNDVTKPTAAYNYFQWLDKRPAVFRCLGSRNFDGLVTFNHFLGFVRVISTRGTMFHPK